jgi:hypothetical protein
MQFPRPTLILSALALLLGSTEKAKADFLVYTSQASFEAATTGLVDTSFSSIVPARGFTGYATPPGFTSRTTGVNFNIANPSPGGRDALNVTSASYYSSIIYPRDFLIQDSGAFKSTIREVITLPTAVRAVGLDRGTFNGTPLAFTFSTGNSYVDSSPPPFGRTSFLGFVASSPISSLTITYNSSDSLVVDDFKFGNAVTPEPASLSLLGLGACCLAGSFVWRWRQQPVTA